MIHLITKSLLEGIAVSLTAYFISNRTLTAGDCILIGAIASAILLLIEYLLYGSYDNANEQSHFSNLIKTYEKKYTGRDQVIPCDNELKGCPYKLVSGQYSDKVLLAGYNASADAYNSEAMSGLSHWPFDDTAYGQSGGDDGSKPPTKYYPEHIDVHKMLDAIKQNNASDTSGAVATPAPATPAAPATPDKKDAHTPAAHQKHKHKCPHFKRLKGVLYSGDVIYIHGVNVGEQGVLMRDSTTMLKIGKNAHTNLSKIRIHGSRGKPLAYGQRVRLVHSIYDTDKHLQRNISFDKNRLHSHHKKKTYYKLVNPKDIYSKENIHNGAHVIFALADESDKYLLIDKSDMTITSTTDAKVSSQFALKRDGRNNKCICRGERLYR